MKVYRADNELAEKLILSGVKEFTASKLLPPGKRIFCLSKKCQRKIYFNRDTIEVINSHIVEDITKEVSEEELITLLMYLKLPPAEVDKLNPGGFKIKEATRKIAKLKEDYKKKDLSNKEQIMITRLITLHDNLKDTLGNSEVEKLNDEYC